MKDPNKKQQHDLTDTSKGNKKDTGNSLERDVTNTEQTGRTPQARTDNEQDRESKKRKS